MDIAFMLLVQIQLVNSVISIKVNKHLANKTAQMLLSLKEKEKTQRRGGRIEMQFQELHPILKLEKTHNTKTNKIHPDTN